MSSLWLQISCVCLFRCWSISKRTLRLHRSTSRTLRLCTRYKNLWVQGLCRWGRGWNPSLDLFDVLLFEGLFVFGSKYEHETCTMMMMSSVHCFSIHFCGTFLTLFFNLFAFVWWTKNHMFCLKTMIRWIKLEKCKIYWCSYVGWTGNRSLVCRASSNFKSHEWFLFISGPLLSLFLTTAAWDKQDCMMLNISFFSLLSLQTLIIFVIPLVSCIAICMSISHSHWMTLLEMVVGVGGGIGDFRRVHEAATRYSWAQIQWNIIVLKMILQHISTAPRWAMVISNLTMLSKHASWSLHKGTNVMERIIGFGLKWNWTVTRQAKIRFPSAPPPDGPSPYLPPSFRQPDQGECYDLIGGSQEGLSFKVLVLTKFILKFL